MSNQFAVTSKVALGCLDVLVNTCVMASKISRAHENDFGKATGQVGDTVNVKKPPRFVVNDGEDITNNIQDIQFKTVPITLDKFKNVAFAIGSKEMELELEDLENDVIRPAMAPLVNAIDYDCMTLYKKIYNESGTPGVSPASSQTFLNALTKLANGGAPQDETQIYSLISPGTNETMVPALQGLFNAQSAISKQYMTGKMGTALGQQFFQTQNVNTHVVGPLGGTPLVNGGTQTGTSLITDGWTAAAASRLLEGDVFTIGSGATGVYRVNPQSRQSTGELQQFVVRADGPSDGSGNLTLTIQPEIIVSGALQTVDKLPPDNATINVLGAASTSTPQNLTFHRSFATLCMASLSAPKGVHMAATKSDPKTGLSVSVVMDFNVLTRKYICRLDVCYGVSLLYPEYAVRVAA